MAKPKKVVAKFTGKGFRIEKNGRMAHNSTCLYTDAQYYKKSEEDDTPMDLLNLFGDGIHAALKNKRIKPGSLRITFQIVEE